MEIKHRCLQSVTGNTISHLVTARIHPRRLSDRTGGYTKDQPKGSGLLIAPGLPTKPIWVDQASSNNTSGSRGDGPLPPPANTKEDPRASAGKKVSYHGMDLVAEGDVELNG